MVVDINFGLRSTTFGETDRFCFGVKSFADFLATPVITQIDQNGVVFDPKTERKCCKNGAFTAVFRVYTIRFRSISYCYRKRAVFATCIVQNMP
jgi:hypothetical protein